MSLIGRLKFSMILSVIPALAITGCGGPAGPAVYPVSGVVLRNGQPLPDVNVEFMPEKGRPSAATTDEDGKFVLEYIEGTQGALAGNHKIRVMEQFMGSTADGPSPARAYIPPEPKSYDLPKPAQVNATKNMFTIDVTAGTATPSS
jgi:hypothetical protein